MTDLTSYISQKQHDEFLFLGKLYTDEKMDFGKWLDEFFKTGGFEKITPHLKNANDCCYHIHIIVPDYWTVYIGNIVVGITEAPEGHVLKKFPSGEFVVVTSEWKPTENEAHESLDENENFRKTPNGYVDDKSTYLCIEKFYECRKKGHRWERWYPIKKQ